MGYRCSTMSRRIFSTAFAAASRRSVWGMARPVSRSTRAFSTAAEAAPAADEYADVRVSEQEYETKRIEPPLYLGSKAGDLAQSLYVYAHIKGKLDAVAKDIRTLAQAYRAHVDLEQLLNDKTVPLEEKRDVVVAFMRELGAWRGTQLFLSEVAMADDLHRIDKIAAAFEELYSQYRSTVPLHIRTSKPASAAELDKIVARIKADNLRPNDDVIMTHEVDPLLVDGYAYALRGTVVDLSMAKQLGDVHAEFTKSLHAEARRLDAATPQFTAFAAARF